VSPWSDWATCQNGIQQRIRNITAYPFANGTPCPLLNDSQNCLIRLLSAIQIFIIVLCFFVIGILFTIFGHFKLFVPSVTDEILPLVKDKDNEKKLSQMKMRKWFFIITMWCVHVLFYGAFGIFISVGSFLWEETNYLLIGFIIVEFVLICLFCLFAWCFGKGRGEFKLI